jgi:hydroxylamine reductase (hybrid-cluster protein)
LGGKFIASPEPREAVKMLLEHIDAKRKKLGLAA